MRVMNIYSKALTVKPQMGLERIGFNNSVVPFIEVNYWVKQENHGPITKVNYRAKTENWPVNL